MAAAGHHSIRSGNPASFVVHVEHEHDVLMQIGAHHGKPLPELNRTVFSCGGASEAERTGARPCRVIAMDDDEMA